MSAKLGTGTRGTWVGGVFRRRTVRPRAPEDWLTTSQRVPFLMVHDARLTYQRLRRQRADVINCDSDLHGCACLIFIVGRKALRRLVATFSRLWINGVEAMAGASAAKISVSSFAWLLDRIRQREGSNHVQTEHARPEIHHREHDSPNLRAWSSAHGVPLPPPRSSCCD